ncbi:TetR/AcrR family transcriptional regulator [Nocardia alni]|uniref:TetR/AcrR family transcriptional regulator n=1 Tax=Nocardia alni TaxID=2815723 RepID=UPI001C21503F|nr:helix-turn-helix domain-containing protein [Nocardia alni]
MRAKATGNDGRNSATREAILTAAERLFAEHGVTAVSNRQVSEAAGQGNNTAVGYHFGAKSELVRAIERHHLGPIERIRGRLVAETTDSADLRDWVTALVRPLTEHLAEAGETTWYARFAAQVMTDPAYYDIVVADALESPTLVRVIEGINHCRSELPIQVHTERGLMARNLLVHTAAEFERALANRAPYHWSDWDEAASGLIDAIVGLWLAPVTPRPAVHRREK